jgi:hypothetical protein
MKAAPHMPNPREPLRELQRMADRVCVLILSSDLPAIDIEIEKNKVREFCLELYPDREQLYEMIYQSTAWPLPLLVDHGRNGWLIG